MRVRWLGTSEYDYADFSRFEDRNLVSNRIQMPANGWIVGLGVEAAGLDASTPAELVLYHQNHDLAVRSGLQTWNTVLQPRTYGIPNADALRVQYSHHFFVGFWAHPAHTRQWRQKLSTMFEHWRATQAGSLPTRLTSWSKNSHALSAWVEFVANAQPLPGRWRTSPSGTIGETNPVFSGYLEHPEGEGGLDRSVAAHMVIHDVTTGATVVNRRIEITAAEVAQGFFSQQFYTHVPGHTYQARYRHVDSWGWWSDFSPTVEYKVAEGPDKPGLTAPSGKVNTLNPSYTGTYSHVTGSASKAVQIRLQNADGTLLLGESNAIAMTGTSFSVAHSSIAQFPALVQGRGYRWLARVQDAQNRWSGYSDAVSYATNSAPFQPTAPAPSGGIYDRAGVLSCTVSDPDGDAIQSVEFEVRNSAGTLLTGYPKTVTGPFASGNRASLSVALDLTLGQTYSWRARASDGNLFGAWTQYTTFIYAAVPTSTILAPVFGGLVNSVATPSAEYGAGFFVLEGADTNHSLSVVAVEGAAYGKYVWRLTKSGANGVSRVALAPARRFPTRGRLAFLGVWLRATSGTMNAVLRLECYDAAGVSLGVISTLAHPNGRDLSVVSTITNTWQRYGMFTGGFLAGTVTVRPFVEFSAASTGTVEIDAWHVYFLDNEPPAASRYWFGYFDGDTESSSGGTTFSWTGVEGLSASIGPNILTDTRPTFRFLYGGDLVKNADRTIIEQLSDTWKQVHDSGWIVRDTTITEPPVGLLKNEAHYRVKIMVRDSNGVTNESQWSEFETKFAGPQELIVRTIGQDDRRAVLTISWEPSTLPTVEFVAYEVSLYSFQEGEVRVARITDPNTNYYEYPFPVSGRQYRARVRQIQAIGPDEIASRWAGNETSVEYTAWFIKDIYEPDARSLSFPIYAGDEPSSTRKANHSAFRPNGRKVPVHYVGEERSREGSLTIRFEVDDEAADANQQMLYELIDSRTVCILGTDPGSKTFAYLDDPSETLTDLPWRATYDVPYQQTYFEEDIFLRRIEKG